VEEGRDALLAMRRCGPARIGNSNHQFGRSLPTIFFIDPRNPPYDERKLRGRMVCSGYSGRQ
jgi:hypothetical protein